MNGNWYVFLFGLVLVLSVLRNASLPKKATSLARSQMENKTTNIRRINCSYTTTVRRGELSVLHVTDPVVVSAGRTVGVVKLVVDAGEDPVTLHLAGHFLAILVARGPDLQLLSTFRTSASANDC